MISTCSHTSSPMRTSAVPSAAHTFSASGRSCTISTRGRKLGSGLRPRGLRVWAATSTPGAASSFSATSAATSASLKSPSCSRLAFSLVRPKRWWRSSRTYSSS
jgi:hypothetical protein